MINKKALQKFLKINEKLKNGTEHIILPVALRIRVMLFESRYPMYQCTLTLFLRILLTEFQYLDDMLIEIFKESQFLENKTEGQGKSMANKPFQLKITYK